LAEITYESRNAATFKIIDFVQADAIVFARFVRAVIHVRFTIFATEAAFTYTLKAIDFIDTPSI
jgi:hypothetical protein